MTAEEFHGIFQILEYSSDDSDSVDEVVDTFVVPEYKAKVAYDNVSVFHFDFTLSEG